MNVHQLSIAYVPQQDRLLARVNTNEGQELQCWITRRLALGLSGLMDKAVAEHAVARGGLGATQAVVLDQQAKQAIAQFQRSETLQKADFATPFKSGQQNQPVFEQPLLVTDIALTPLDNGQLRLAFSENLVNDQPARGFQLALGDQLLHAFVHLLDKAVLQSQWRDGVPRGGAHAEREPESHDGSGRTGYLN